MPINNYNLKSIGACIIAIMALNNDGLCQSYPVIDIDNVEALILPEYNSENEYAISDSDGLVLYFNEILKIVGKQKTSYEVEYVPSYEGLEIYQGRVFINLDKKKSVYDLETLNDITSVNDVYYPECIVTERSEKVYEKDERYKATFGEYPSRRVRYMFSIDAATGDTLWKKQIESSPHIRSANHVSMVGDSIIIDNKSGKTMYKIKSSKPINAYKIKEDSGYLYLMRGVNKHVELIAIDMQKDEAIWKVRGKSFGFYFDESRIYTTDMCAIDKKTGKLLWNNIDGRRIVGMVGDYLIAPLDISGEGAEMYLIRKENGKTVGHLWSDNEFCKNCFGDDYESCASNFVFATKGDGNKTAAIIKCNDGVYLYVFEAK